VKPDELPTLTAAIQAIDFNHESLAGYDDFFKLFLAICASVSGDTAYFDEVVWPQLEKYPKNTYEAMEDKWRSCKTSSLGPDYVYHVAARFGCGEAQRAITNATDLVALYGPPVEPDEPGGLGADGEGMAAGVGDGAAVPAASAGALAPGNTDIAIRDSFLAKDLPYRHIIEFRDPNQAWVKQTDGLWVPAYPAFAADIAAHCSEIGDRYRLTGGRGGPEIDRALKNANTHGRLERMLSKSPAISASLTTFDGVPYLLNTPHFVVDLRDGTGRAHESLDLFRLRTAVSPDFGMYGPPTRWLQVLERFAEGKGDWLIDVLQRWFGYTLTGYTDWQYMLFIPGPPGTGKSFIVRVIKAMMGSYAKQKNPEFFVLRRNQDERFAYDDLAGLRGVLGTETLDNATWHETRIVQIADGDELDVEFKGGAKRAIQSQAKITIAGNHEPRFPTGDREGGLPRRMMRLYIGKEYKLAEADKDDQLLNMLVEKEGPQILTWLMQGAWKALHEGRQRFHALAEPLFAAAAEYANDSNPRGNYLKDRRIVKGDPNVDYLTLASTYKDYLEYRRTEEPGFHETRRTFKNAMADMFDWKWEPVGRGEPDTRKHGTIAAYGWKYADAPV
jgi:putative DNA primase/helicase